MARGAPFPVALRAPWAIQRLEPCTNCENAPSVTASRTKRRRRRPPGSCRQTGVYLRSRASTVAEFFTLEITAERADAHGPDRYRIAAHEAAACGSSPAAEDAPAHDAS